MIELILVLILMAFIMEIVDTSLGMMYGTILSPLLIGYGFEPMLVVPAILISQAIGGIGGTVSHHIFKNANFNGFTTDTKVVLSMVLPGLIAVVLGALVVVSIPKIVLKTYIGILVIIMSVLCLHPYRYEFRWWKHIGIGSVAAFNKVLTGGGFGPVTSTGGILAGLDARVSIATTTFAEVVICLSAFGMYVALFGVKNPVFISSLCIGAVIGGLIGPYISSRVSHKKLRAAVGVLGIISGVWILLRLLM